MTTATDVRTVGVWRATPCVTASRSAETVRMKPLTNAEPSNARAVRTVRRRYFSRKTFYSLHIMFIFRITLHMHRTSSRPSLQCFLHISCLLELQPLTDHREDVQAWRNNDDWQPINNTRSWLDERIQGLKSQSNMQLKNFGLMVTQQYSTCHEVVAGSAKHFPCY